MMQKVSVTVEGKEIQFPEKEYSAILVDPDIGMVLVWDSRTFEIGKLFVEAMGEKFGISKKEILQLPDPCYDLARYKEMDYEACVIGDERV